MHKKTAFCCLFAGAPNLTRLELNCPRDQRICRHCQDLQRKSALSLLEYIVVKLICIKYLFYFFGFFQI